MPEFSKGLEGVVAAETQMSFIDGQQGVLEYVGIAIGDLASSSNFEETVFLLWNKKLPTRAELDAFTKDLRANYDPPQGILDMVKGMPKDAQPMHVLRTLVSALSLFDENPNANDVPAAREKALKILAATPAISTGTSGVNPSPNDTGSAANGNGSASRYRHIEGARSR